MIVLSLLATSALITLAGASPMSYATYRRREFPEDDPSEVMLLEEPKDQENKSPPQHNEYDIDREYQVEVSLQDLIPDAGITDVSKPVHPKRLGLARNSLSIANPIEVLRERVRYELARRKMLQNQRQIDANRRFLESVGKRSVQEIDPGYPRTSGPVLSSDNNRVYTNKHQSENQEQAHQSYTQRIPAEGAREWYNVDDSVIRGSSNGDDETRKVLFNYHHDRI